MPVFARNDVGIGSIEVGQRDASVLAVAETNLACRAIKDVMGMLRVGTKEIADLPPDLKFTGFVDFQSEAGNLDGAIVASDPLGMFQ